MPPANATQTTIMKRFNYILKIGWRCGAILSLVAFTFSGFADDKKTAPKPDKLSTCPVSDDKLGEMGKPFVFTYKDREVKLCCSGCKKDFDKDPAKYIKKIEAADKVKKN